MSSSLLSNSEEDEDLIVIAAAAVELDSRNICTGGQVEVRRQSSNRGEFSWFRDYLNEDSNYSAWYFRRRLRIPLNISRLLERNLRVVELILKQPTDATG